MKFETKTSSFLPWFSKKSVWVNKDHWTRFLNPIIFIIVIFLSILMLDLAIRCIQPEPVINDRIIKGDPGKVF